MHTGGVMTKQLRLANGVTYGFDDKPLSPLHKPYRQLSEDAFYELVGEFFNQWAQHLDKLGVLDCAYIFVDETIVAEYPLLHRWAAAIKAKFYGKRNLRYRGTAKRRPSRQLA
jgi:hypothetical protein